MYSYTTYSSSSSRVFQSNKVNRSTAVLVRICYSWYLVVVHAFFPLEYMIWKLGADETR